jgi:hypothetical protein
MGLKGRGAWVIAAGQGAAVALGIAELGFVVLSGGGAFASIVERFEHLRSLLGQLKMLEVFGQMALPSAAKAGFSAAFYDMAEAISFCETGEDLWWGFGECCDRRRRFWRRSGGIDISAMLWERTSNNKSTSRSSSRMTNKKHKSNNRGRSRSLHCAALRSR